jgi:tRNA-2-methylthio-N6-dimethylallyladenosine synthase
VNEVATERAQRFQDRTLEVLVEGVNPKDPSQAYGRIRHNRLAYFAADGAALKGRLAMVHIKRCNAYSLFGELVEVLPVGAGERGEGRLREREYERRTAGLSQASPSKHVVAA